MTIKQLQYFISIVENQSFKRAAEVLYVSAPALTQQINSLEKELGCTLIIRSAQNFHLTDTGRFFYENVHSIINQLETVIVKIRHMENTSAKPIVVGYISTPMDLLIRQAVKAFHSDHPTIEIELYPCELNEIPYLLETHTIDISYVTQNYVSSNQLITYVPSCNYTYDLVLPLDHPLSSKEDLQLSDLIRTPFILLNPKHNTNLFNNYMEANLNGFQKHYADSTAELYLMMRQEKGFSILPSYLHQTRPDVRNFPLLPILSDSLGVSFLSSCQDANMQQMIPYLLQFSSSTAQFNNLSLKNLL